MILSPGTAPDEIHLVVHAHGDTAEIWSSFLTNAAVVSSDRPFGDTWTTNTVALPAYRQGGATIGIDTEGNLTACWRTYTAIRVADKLAGGNWGSAMPFAIVASGEFGTDLAVAGDAAVAIWLGRSFQAMVSNLVVSP